MNRRKLWEELEKGVVSTSSGQVGLTRVADILAAVDDVRYA